MMIPFQAYLYDNQNQVHRQFLTQGDKGEQISETFSSMSNMALYLNKTVVYIIFLKSAHLLTLEGSKPKRCWVSLG